MSFRSRKSLPVLGVLALVTIAYANHFKNDFHFDDFHTISTNAWIRDLNNIPKFFTDATTFSTLPANCTWRPLVSTTIAIDYWLGKGYHPVYFQVSTFAWFLLQLWLMYALFRRLLDMAGPTSAAFSTSAMALFAVALYGVHPAMAETVNYIIQRGDVYSTLAVIAGLLIYIRWPARRNQLLYLIPVVFGLLSKPPTLIFPAILLTYLLLFEEVTPARALLSTTPSIILSAALGYVSRVMTPKSFDAGAWPAFDYRITQPLVALRYFRNFFVPLYFSADTDHVAESNILHGYAWLGVLFVLAILAIAIWCGRRRELRPIAFGIYWYILALIPTSIFPLAEVENDHRMFFPFVGLVFSLVYAAALLCPAGIRLHPRRAIAICAVILFAAGYGTWRRNIVWKNEESLWYDVTLKSPKNGRGLMNYGLTQMEKGDYVRALSYFNRAVEYNPDYYVLEINLGIANGALNNDEEGERHFQRALELAPQDAQALYFYAIWLRDRGRAGEAIDRLNMCIASDPAYVDCSYLLMSVYADRGQMDYVQQVARNVLAQFPTDTVAQSWLAGKRPQ